MPHRGHADRVPYVQEPRDSGGRLAPLRRVRAEAPQAGVPADEGRAAALLHRGYIGVAENGNNEKIPVHRAGNGRVFGISKLVRLVEKYSKRLQIQDRLTKNIADELYSQGIKGVAVMTDAEHLCMKMRGVKNDAKLTCSAFRGIYEDQKIKQEIIKTIQTRPTAQV